MRDHPWHDGRTSPVGDEQPDEIRAGNADRDATAELLRTHHAAGRLSDDEFQERLEASMAARTLGELRVLAADLPAPAARRPGRGWGWRRGPFGFRVLPVALVLTVVWGAFARHAAWHHDYAGYPGHHGPWFPSPLLLLLLPLLGAAAFAALRRRARYMRRARSMPGAAGGVRWA